MSLHLPAALDPRLLLRPRRRGIASVSAEVRDGIVPAGDRIAETTDHAGGAPRGANYRTVALIIASAMFMENLDATVLATALPTMARDFGVRAPEMSIALTSYLLALAVFIPASGTMADRFGARPVFRAAIGLFVHGLARLRPVAQPAGAGGGALRARDRRRDDDAGRAGSCCSARSPSATWCRRCRG